MELQVTLFTIPDGERFDGLEVMAGETAIELTEVEDSRSGYRTFHFTMPEGDVSVTVLHSQYRFAINMLNGSLRSNQIEFFSAKTVEVEVQPGTHWTLDGEYEKGNGICEIKTIESAISLIK